GLAWPKPGSGVCQRRFSPEATFHVTGAASADTPLAWGPRNCGQFVAVPPANPAHVSRRTKQTWDSRWSRSAFMEERLLRSAQTVDGFDLGAVGLGLQDSRQQSPTREMGRRPRARRAVLRGAGARRARLRAWRPGILLACQQVFPTPKQTGPFRRTSSWLLPLLHHLGFCRLDL